MLHSTPLESSHTSLNSTSNPRLPHNAAHRGTHRSCADQIISNPHDRHPIQRSPLPCLTLPDTPTDGSHSPGAGSRGGRAPITRTTKIASKPASDAGCGVRIANRLPHRLQDSGPKAEEKRSGEAGKGIACVPWLEAELRGALRRSAGVWRGASCDRASERASSVCANLEAQAAQCC